MLLSLVDALQCPALHQPSPLVLTVHQWSGQRVIEGELGCPVCQARYAIRDGIPDFTATATQRTGDSAEIGVVPDEHGAAGDSRRERALRLAAQLALGQPGGFVLLAGRYAGLHEALLDVVDTTCVLVDSPRPPASAAVSIRVQETLPIVDGAMRGAAVDTHKAPGFLAEVTRCLGAGSRLVAASSMALPPAVQLLARDEREWVAEVPGVLPTVPLGRSTRLSRP